MQARADFTDKAQEAGAEQAKEEIAALEKAVDVLTQAATAVFDLRNLRFVGSADTVFAIGEVVGTISKAKAFIRRDLDDCLARRPSVSAALAPDRAAG